MDAEVRLKAGPFHLGGDVAAVHESPDDQDHEDHGHGEHGNPPDQGQKVQGVFICTFAQDKYQDDDKGQKAEHER